MIKAKAKKKCLLMCATPLQALIAEKIIEKDPDSIFYLIFTDHDYENRVKFKYYYNRLKTRCVQSIYWTDYYGLKNFLRFRIKVKLAGLDIKYEKLYLANLERKHFSYMVSQNPNSDLFTFDDGTGNINIESHFYSNERPTLIKRIVWRSLGVKYFIPDLRQKSKLHYTIYKDLPNIIDNTEYIPLYTSDKSGLTASNNKITRIYLGHPLGGVNSKFDKNYINKILKNLEIDYYFPHPRENASVYTEFNTINSQLIFEDYIVEYLRAHPDTEVHIYSLISGALLNINKLDRVNVKYIYDSFLQDNYPDFYTLVKDEFGVGIIKI